MREGEKERETTFKRFAPFQCRNTFSTPVLKEAESEGGRDKLPGAAWVINTWVP